MNRERRRGDGGWGGGVRGEQGEKEGDGGWGGGVNRERRRGGESRSREKRVGEEGEANYIICYSRHGWYNYFNIPPALYTTTETHQMVEAVNSTILKNMRHTT